MARIHRLAQLRPTLAVSINCVQVINHARKQSSGWEDLWLRSSEHGSSVGALAQKANQSVKELLLGAPDLEDPNLFR